MKIESGVSEVAMPVFTNCPELLNELKTSLLDASRLY